MGIQHLPFTGQAQLTQFAEGGSGSVTPSGLMVRSTADAVTGVADGGTLSGWDDISGSGRHWTIGGTGSPKYRATAGPGSTPAVEVGSSGSDGYFICDAALLTALAAANQAEVFIVLKAAASSANAGLWYFSACAFSAHYHYSDTNTIYETFGMATRIDAISTGSLTQWRLYNVSSSPGAQTVRLDGTLIATGSSNFSMAGGWLGESQSFNTADLQIADIQIWNRVLNASERDTVEGQLAAKYGLTIA